MNMSFSPAIVEPIKRTLAQRWGFYKFPPSLEGQVQPPPPLVIAAFCSPQPFNSTKDSSSEGFAGPQPFLINRLDQT
ncbi:hypothetical protein QL285_010309 [Trifolium repens]|nr:hypothetical protein QL285_010309 [Trifolium repens]